MCISIYRYLLIPLISILPVDLAMGQVVDGDNEGQGTALAKNPVSRSVGATRHFNVWGHDIRRNKAVASLSDDLVRKVYKFVGEPVPKAGFHPVHLHLYSKGEAKKGSVFSTSVIPIAGGGYNIKLVVDIRTTISKLTLEQAIMQAIVLERTMRSDPDVNKDTKVSVPRWVSDGLLGAIKWKNDKLPRGMFVLLRNKPELYSVKELFLTTDEIIAELGDTKSDIYMASATAMVLSLQRQKKGKKAFSQLLSEVAVFEGEPEELLRRNFTVINVGAKGLQKLWSLQLADMSVPKLSETKGILATDNELERTLFFILTTDDGVVKSVPIKDYDVLVGVSDKERIKVVSLLRRKIVQVSYRCYPDYQSILAEYGFIMTSLSKGVYEGVGVRLKNLKAERVQIVDAGERVRNYLDWYRINTAKDLAGDFKGYEKLIEQMAMEQKRDADKVISPYLDKMEQLMQR